MFTSCEKENNIVSEQNTLSEVDNLEPPIYLENYVALDLDLNLDENQLKIDKGIEGSSSFKMMCTGQEINIIAGLGPASQLYASNLNKWIEIMNVGYGGFVASCGFGSGGCTVELTANVVTLANGTIMGILWNGCLEDSGCESLECLENGSICMHTTHGGFGQYTNAVLGGLDGIAYPKPQLFCTYSFGCFENQWNDGTFIHDNSNGKIFPISPSKTCLY